MIIPSVELLPFFLRKIWFAKNTKYLLLLVGNIKWYFSTKNFLRYFGHFFGKHMASDSSYQRWALLWHRSDLAPPRFQRCLGTEIRSCQVHHGHKRPKATDGHHQRWDCDWHYSLSDPLNNDFSVFPTFRAKSLRRRNINIESSIVVSK